MYLVNVESKPCKLTADDGPKRAERLACLELGEGSPGEFKPKEGFEPSTPLTKTFNTSGQGVRKTLENAGIYRDFRVFVAWHFDTRA